MNLNSSKFGEGTAFYQHEPLTVRLKNLIHDYPEGVGIVKELIQNADDAGASIVKITFDWRTHPFTQLPDDRMVKLMGPTMLVYNDSVFSDADFENIQRLGMGGKREILWKTGRFGVGFNSVYHVTDYPSFISRDRLVFFDPHASAIPGTSSGEPGRSWQFAKEGWWDYPDFMRVYEPGGLEFGVENFNGTLFRLPLRTADHARSSEIRSQPFTERNVQELLQELISSGEEILLFLKSVVEIQVFEIQSDGQKRNLLTVTTKNRQFVQTERQKLLSPLQGSPEALLTLCQTHPNTLPCVSYLHTIETTDETNCITSTWRITSIIRVDETRELLKVLRDLARQKEKAVPWAGAAALISRTSNSYEYRPFVGRAYCFLPLPQKTGLPIHIHGFFDLDSSRRELTSDDSLTGRDRSRVDWNKLLVRHVLSHACANLIDALVQDIGENNPSEFYKFWPVGKMINKVLEELPRSLIGLLHHKRVIRSALKQDSTRWVTPASVRVLPTEWKVLTKPLSADGVVLPEPEIPISILTAFKTAGCPLQTFEPTHLRRHLMVNKALGVRLEEAPRPSLRRKEWVIILLHYCLSDNCQDLRGLPLALLANGKLQTFGYNPPGFIYMADRETMQLFTNYPNWFLSPDLLNQRFVIPENRRIGLLQMTPIEVAKRLRDVIDPNHTTTIQWQPNSTTLPNAQWLAQVYRYLTEVKNLPIEELREVPLVPANDGFLYSGGFDSSPLWCGSIEQETDETLTYFGVSLVQAQEPLLGAIASFITRHPNELIWHLTVPDLIDTLTSKATVPPYNERLYKALVSFLADRHWISGEGKQDQDRHNKLCQLPIYPTTDNHPVTLQNKDVYSPGGYTPPRIAGSLKLLCLGLTPNSQEWKPLFDLLKVPVLDHPTLISKCILPGYNFFDNQQQLEALEWIRDNLNTAQTQLDRQSKNSAELKKQITSSALIHCQDGNLRAAEEIYIPDSYEEVRQIIGNLAHTPNMQFYARSRERWIDFFRELRMRNTPSPNDLLAHIDQLIKKATQVGVDAVAKSLIDIFHYIETNWEKLEYNIVTTENKPLAEALKIRAWLPVECQEDSLKRFPGFKIPTAKLYRADEVCLIQSGHLVASQKPLFAVREPKSEVQKALGFRFPDRLDVVNHFKVLIDLWEVGNTSNIDDKDFQKSLDNIYRYFSNTFLGNKANDADKQWLRNQLAGRKCLWDYVEFWQPNHTFQEPVPFFGKRRTKINPPSPMREVYELLGQKRSPDFNDYLAFINELASYSNGNALGEEDAECAIKVLNRLAIELTQEENPAENLDILLLTEDNLLLPAKLVLIPDAPWRLEGIRKSGFLSVLHTKVSPDIAKLAGSPSLLDDLIEQPKGKVKTTDDPEANELCRFWQTTLKSFQFREGLERLILDEHNFIEPLNLDWIRQVRVLPALEIVTDLYLSDKLIASDVPGDYYFASEYCVFYLRFDSDDPDTMLDYLAQSLNNQLGEYKLGDRSRLIRIFDSEPKNIKRLLDKLRVRSLPTPVEESLSSDQEELTEDPIFDEDIIVYSGDSTEFSELSEDIAILESSALSKNTDKDIASESLTSANQNSVQQNSFHPVPTSPQESTNSVPTLKAQLRQVGNTDTSSNPSTSGTSAPSPYEASTLHSRLPAQDSDTEFEEDEEILHEEQYNNLSSQGGRTILCTVRTGAFD